MGNKILKNYIYNFTYQIAALIIPLITAPYLSRIIGVEGIGTYSYYYSIVHYFSMFVLLGISNYGNRSIARCLGDKNKIETTFSELFSLQFLCGLIVTGAYAIYLTFLCKETVLCLCYLPFIISSVFDINWFFFGQENFRIVVIRNIVIKISTTILIFLLVKSADDLPVYILIMSVGYLVSQLVVWPIVLREYKLRYPGIKKVLYHLKPNLILFIPFISVSIYRQMDKIMIGNLSSIIEVGYYENAEKLISLLLSFITAIGTVMLPRMSALYMSNNKNEINSMISKTSIVMSFMASSVAFGVASISRNLVLWFYGDAFGGSIPILKILCVTIPFICYANIIRMQILIPRGKDRTYVLSTVYGAVINLVFNILFIPKLGGIGAALGTVLAEIAVMIYQFVAVREELNLRTYVKIISFLWINGLIMFIVVSMVGTISPICFSSMIIQILIGAVVYGVGILIYYSITKDEVILSLLSSFKGHSKIRS
jgi:O-antigen/teichoic acid export membrane protein